MPRHRWRYKLRVTAPRWRWDPLLPRSPHPAFCPQLGSCRPGGSPPLTNTPGGQKGSHKSGPGPASQIVQIILGYRDIGCTKNRDPICLGSRRSPLLGVPQMLAVTKSRCLDRTVWHSGGCQIVLPGDASLQERDSLCPRADHRDPSLSRTGRRPS